MIRDTSGDRSPASADAGANSGRGTRDHHRPRLTSAEATAVALLAAPVSIVLGAYLLDLAGLRFMPPPMLLLALAAAASCAFSFGRRATPSRADAIQFGLVVAAMGAWLLWLASPSMLPLSTGPDLTHHLLLIRYIEEHWTLVHDPALEQFLGEMAQYTPGSHILAALAGAWYRADGLRALHAVQSATVALKTGFLVLIAARMLPARAPRALALVSVVLLLESPRYFLGGFTEYGFVAQVVAELFVVAMWWVMTVWNDHPAIALDLIFGCVGAAAFLTWPVYTGPPALAFALVVAARREMGLPARLRHLVAAFTPLAAFALVYLIGRLGWLQLAGTGGAAPWPAIASYGWPLVAVGSAGAVLAILRRRGGVTVMFLVAVLAQAAVLYALARRNGAPQPYMALKMFYLLLWPLAACAVMPLGELWERARLTGTRYSGVLAWTLVALVLVSVSRPLMRTPQLTHPLPPATSAPLYEAGKWARSNLPAGCIEYLVGDDETAYWLHLAVLGNPRMSARTGDNATYEPSDAVIRWLTPGGLPWAIADVPALSRDVRTGLDIVRQFGTAAIVKRRGAASCDARP